MLVFGCLLSALAGVAGRGGRAHCAGSAAASRLQGPPPPSPRLPSVPLLFSPLKRRSGSAGLVWRLGIGRARVVRFGAEPPLGSAVAGGQGGDGVGCASDLRTCAARMQEAWSMTRSLPCDRQLPEE
jgi:hypothetical protein